MNNKGQNAIEYMLLAVVVVGVSIATMAPDGLLTRTVTQSVNQAITGYECEASTACYSTDPADCQPFCGNGCCEEGEDDGSSGVTCPEDCAFCTPDPNPCVAASCGSVTDGCDIPTVCFPPGACVSPETCQDDNTCSCTNPGDPCSSVQCGLTTDACDNTVNCDAVNGGCGPGETCSGNICTCTAPNPCGANSCGIITDACGVDVNCDAGSGGCAPTQICTSANTCCTPTVTCSDPGVCGNIADNGCGVPLSCGSSCPGVETCFNNSCCTPTDPCTANTCGAGFTDGCGTPITCPDNCSALAPLPNNFSCQAGTCACTRDDCFSIPNACGSYPDGCGGLEPVVCQCNSYQPIGQPWGSGICAFGDPEPNGYPSCPINVANCPLVGDYCYTCNGWSILYHRCSDEFCRIPGSWNNSCSGVGGGTYDCGMGRDVCGNPVDCDWLFSLGPFGLGCNSSQYCDTATNSCLVAPAGDVWQYAGYGINTCSATATGCNSATACSPSGATCSNCTFMSGISSSEFPTEYYLEENFICQ